MDIDMLPTRVNPRQPQGSFVQNTGLELPEGHCIVSCDRTRLNYQSCSWNSAPPVWLSSQRSKDMALVGAALL
jgi:hypothetical protein